MKLIYGERELALVKSTCPGNRLPKRFAYVTNVVVDGEPVAARVTTNAAWSADAEKTLEYIWVERAGVGYYATLDYAEKVSEWTGAELKIADGVAARKDPVRVTAAGNATLREAERVAKFKAWAAARAEA
jgi:hypothetical protein